MIYMIIYTTLLAAVLEIHLLFSTLKQHPLNAYILATTCFMWMLVIIHTPATNFPCGFDILSDPLVFDMVATATCDLC